MIASRFNLIVILILTTLLSACGFHPQGTMKLAKPLHKLYIKSVNPYGDLVRYLEKYLKMSSVTLVADSKDADTVLDISQDDNSQELTGISGTQQTRQYNLRVTVTFDVSDKKGKLLIKPQTLAEARSITIQSNQILGSSNEANLYYQQMRRTLSYGIMTRLSSHSATKQIEQGL